MSEVLRWKLEWMLLVTVIFQCLWVYKRRADMSEAVSRDLEVGQGIRILLNFE